MHKPTSKHLMVFDPVPFAGGSKVATSTILNAYPSENITLTLVTAHPESWRSVVEHYQGRVTIRTMPLASLLSQFNQKGFYLLTLYRFILCLWHIATSRKIDLLVGSTQPGSDMALYGVQWLLSIPLLQLVHGPVGHSRSVAKCLQAANQVHYLTSSKRSIEAALQTVQLTLADIQHCSFDNGIAAKDWPTPCQDEVYQDNDCRLLWAGSLLKWKRLDLLVDTLQNLNSKSAGNPVSGDICYLKPSRHVLASEANQPIAHIEWHHQPKDFDTIRSRCSIFISTSEREPFGLAILEAMAAGLCPVIPQDGAYWDQKLRHGKQCLKYSPNNGEALSQSIVTLQQNPKLRKKLARAAQRLATDYQAHLCYQTIYQDIDRLTHHDLDNKKGQGYE